MDTELFDLISGLALVLPAVPDLDPPYPFVVYYRTGTALLKDLAGNNFQEIATFTIEGYGRNQKALHELYDDVKAEVDNYQGDNFFFTVEDFEIENVLNSQEIGQFSISVEGRLFL